VYQRKKMDKFEQEMGGSALKVQNSFRGMKARRATRAIREKKNKWLKDKSLGRYFVLQREYMLQQEKLHGENALIIQQNVRLFVSRMRVKKLRNANSAEYEQEQMNYAALIIQNKNRQRTAKAEMTGRKAKMELLKQELNHQKQLDMMADEMEQRGMATKLQGRVRIRNAKIDVQKKREKKQEEAGAVKVQSLIRGKLAKKEIGEKKEKERLERQEQSNSATRLQALYRGNMNRVNMAGRIEELKVKREQNEALLLFKSVVRLQVSERSEGALMKTIILAMKCAKWLQT